MIVSVGIAPSRFATRWERTFSGEISETSRSIFGRSNAQSRMAAAASVAEPRPQHARPPRPAGLGLSMAPGACPGRRLPAAPVEDHQARLTDQPPVGSGL